MEKKFNYYVYDGKAFINIIELAKLYGFSNIYIYTLLKKQDFPTIRIDRTIFYKYKDVSDYLNEKIKK